MSEIRLLRGGPNGLLETVHILRGVGVLPPENPFSSASNVLSPSSSNSRSPTSNLSPKTGDIYRDVNDRGGYSQSMVNLSPRLYDSSPRSSGQHSYSNSPTWRNSVSPPQSSESLRGSLSDATEESLGITFSLGTGPGITVRRVRPGGAAERAGITLNDLVLAVDHVKVNNMNQNDVVALFKRASARGSVICTLLRNGQGVQRDVVISYASDRSSGMTPRGNIAAPHSAPKPPLSPAGGSNNVPKTLTTTAVNNASVRPNTGMNTLTNLSTNKTTTATKTNYSAPSSATTTRTQTQHNAVPPPKTQTNAPNFKEDIRSLIVGNKQALAQEKDGQRKGNERRLCDTSTNKDLELHFIFFKISVPLPSF
jgi:hypothetical protein